MIVACTFTTTLLGKKEDNGSWEVFWLIRKDAFYASELVDGEPSMASNQHWK